MSDDPNFLEMKKYVEEQLRLGVPELSIRNTLTEQGGWTKEDLDKVFNILIKANHSEEFNQHQAEANNLTKDEINTGNSGVENLNNSAQFQEQNTFGDNTITQRKDKKSFYRFL